MGNLDISKIAAVASAGAAWFALAASAISVYLSLRALRIAERQENKHDPQLVPYLVDAFSQSAPKSGRKSLAFLVSISNRSAASNAVARCELNVFHRISEENEITLKILAEDIVPPEFEHVDNSILNTPTSIEPHQTIEGWTYFTIDDRLLENSLGTSKYKVVFTDSHGSKSVIEPSYVRTEDVSEIQ